MISHPHTSTRPKCFRLNCLRSSRGVDPTCLDRIHVLQSSKVKSHVSLHRRYSISSQTLTNCSYVLHQMIVCLRVLVFVIHEHAMSQGPSLYRSVGPAFFLSGSLHTTTPVVSATGNLQSRYALQETQQKLRRCKRYKPLPHVFKNPVATARESEGLLDTVATLLFRALRDCRVL